ncbi:hypothetical protein, partial [Rosistilla oblonga]|uniref:hypothetical protein n=1 Tax=Rosistilla oblonga TaxID=2527990 RepID=UPI003A97BB8D
LLVLISEDQRFQNAAGSVPRIRVARKQYASVNGQANFIAFAIHVDCSRRVGGEQRNTNLRRSSLIQMHVVLRGERSEQAILNS